MIVVDTSALIDSLCEPRRSFEAFETLIASGELLALPAVVLYEWLRGPRSAEELLDQESILPSERVISFGPAEAARAAQLYKLVSRARGREIDLAIAATALVREAALWTLNPEDFRDIPGLQLV